MAVAADRTEKLIIFDTTLRDGEQSPGVSLSVEEKVEIAKQLSRLGVDVCEAGFPVASEADFEAVQRIAREIGPLTEGRKSGKPMVICGLARSTQKDIQAAYEAVRYAPLHRIHTFLATSDIHLEHKLKISRDECVHRAVNAVRFAKNLCNDVEFSPEDAGRSDRDFLCHIISEVIQAGATTINIPDTVGYTTPEDYGSLIEFLRLNVLGGDGVIWSTHCHNDLGLATANALSAINNGARQVEVTVNGIGERAGNTALEEIVMTLFVHQKRVPVYTDINTTLLYRTSKLVMQKTGMTIQPNKAIVGSNAFAHQSGIHQDGMLKHGATYEIINPSVVGQASTSIVLGKLSGRSGLKSRLEELGFSDIVGDVARFEEIFVKFKALADTKSQVLDADLMALVSNGTNLSARYVLYDLQVVTSVRNIHIQDRNLPPATATIVLVDKQDSIEPRMDASTGNGPISAIFNCIDRLLHLCDEIEVDGYDVKSVTGGSDALGTAFVRIRSRKNVHQYYQGHGIHCDILTASALAYIDAINRYVSDTKK